MRLCLIVPANRSNTNAKTPRAPRKKEMKSTGCSLSFDLAQRNLASLFPTLALLASWRSFLLQRANSRHRLTNAPACLRTIAMDAQIDGLKWDANGLVPAVIQDDKTGQVLVLFWMNKEALEKTIQTGKVHTYSRSRGRLALKGETSGHFEHVKSVFTDCDKDVVLIRVEQIGAACHEGYYSCFFREYQKGGDDWKIVGRRVFDPQEVYHKK
jgi:phosphoribosyl-AMP cyclohydrolase